MKVFLGIVGAEMRKQYKNYFHSKFVYFSLFLWPMITFVNGYYQFKPFDFSAVSKTIPYLNEKSLLSFVLIGYMAMIFFRTLVQSAWRFSMERTAGTLELVYLSPASRLAIVLGNCLSALVNSVWLFLVFMVGIQLTYSEVLIQSPFWFTMAFIMMIVMSVLWGMLLNGLFIFTRDSSFLFTILEEPMEIFAGVKVPVSIMPLWAQFIAGFFPLTYAIKTLRMFMFEQVNVSEIFRIFGIMTLVCITMFILTLLILHYGEKYNRKTGHLALF